MKVPSIIVGGGMAGVSVAVCLLKKGIDFLLIESSPRLGGKVETQRTDDACLEFGPTSFANPTVEMNFLLDELGLRQEILEPAPIARNRFILKDGKIVRLPAAPQEMLTTRALSFRGRVRLQAEAQYVPPKREGEESVHRFFSRHFGREVADYFADPFVSGVYAGDARTLSLKEAFPTMAEAEAQCGSLIRYLVGRRRTSKASPTSYQLKGGLGSIFQRAAERISHEKIRLNEPVRSVVPEQGGYRLVTERGEYQTGRLYLTAPAYAAAGILGDRFPDLSQPLAAIHYSPVVSIHLRVSRGERFPFDGFGILIPSGEKRRLLGVLWNSSVFPSLFADTNHHYLTAYCGGDIQSDLVHRSDSELHELVLREAQDLFELSRQPEVLSLRRHDRAIPQYTLGYGRILSSLESALGHYPNLRLAGNYWGGVSLPKTVARAVKIAYEGSGCP